MNPEEIKTQIIEQIKKSDLENKDQAIMQVKTMTKEQLEAFVQQQSQSQCIFCSIIKGEIPSTKIDENEDALAILELNPISKAHTLIIPKKHIESADKIPPKATDLAKKITDLIKERFKPKKPKNKTNPRTIRTNKTRTIKS
jgi:galactose-1-phosphate uridylyltransferase